MPRMELVISVVAGEPRHRWCDECLTSAAYEVDVFAMVPSGLQKLATVEGCDGCNRDGGGALSCHYCVRQFASVAEWGSHLRDAHGEPAG